MPELAREIAPDSSSVVEELKLKLGTILEKMEGVGTFELIIVVLESVEGNASVGVTGAV